MPPLTEISTNRQRRKETTEKERSEAFGMRVAGATWSGIARAMQRPESTLRRIVKASDSRNFENLKGRGRRSILSERTKRHILKEIGRDSKIEYKSLLPAVGLNATNRRAVANWLKTIGIRKWIAKQRPLLTEEHARKRLDFALQWRGVLDSESLKKVIFSDEILIYPNGNNPRHWTFRRAGEQYEKQHIDGKVRSSGKYVMIWASIWSNTSTEIQELERDPTAPRGGCSSKTYIELLSDQLPQFYEEGMLFMQDNAKIYKARVVMDWFADNNIELLENWPPYSPDLNPIEHCWARLRDLLLNYCDDFGNITGDYSQEQNILKAVTKAWNDLTEEYIESCTSSFLRRLDAVIEAQGWYTKY